MEINMASTALPPSGATSSPASAVSREVVTGPLVSYHVSASYWRMTEDQTP